MSESMSAWLLLQNSLWAGIAAMGIAVLLNVPLRTLPGCGVCGATGLALHILLTETGVLNTGAATLAASTVVGFLSVMFGRRWRTPALIMAVPGVIPLIPGVLAFRTMVDLVTLTTTNLPSIDEALLLETTINAFKTIFIVLGIAGGVAIPSLLLRRHRPMV